MKHKANKTNHYAYNTNLRERAHKLRYNMTKAEACLWKYALRAGGMRGYGFRRQRPVLNYIADFMCKELMLIIEVDGITHQFEETIKKDKIRQKNLEEVGFKVLRFTDSEVLNNIAYVKEVLSREILEIEAKMTTPYIPRRRGTKNKNHERKYRTLKRI